MKLRYAGKHKVAFVELGIEVEPGDAFTVEDAQAERYLRRADVKRAAGTAQSAPKVDVQAPPEQEPKETI